MITKDDFTKIMTTLEAQYRYDEEYSKNLSQALGFGEGEIYNNQELVECIVTFLASNFEKAELADKLIKDFMYDCDFGAMSEVITSSDKFWMVLIDECVLKSCDSKPEKKNRSISTADLERILNNIYNLTSMYKNVFFKDGPDSELQSIATALEVSVDFLKEFIKEDSDSTQPRVQRGITITKIRTNE